jgi:hypothetical protein
MSEKLPNDDGPKKSPELEKMLVEDFDELFKNMPITDDTRCGIGFLNGRFLQK